MEELILLDRKFKNDMVELINKSKLPAFVLKPILKDMVMQLDELENEQYEIAKKHKESLIQEGNKEQENEQ